MEKISKEVVNLIAPIVANEIGVKILDGINWALILNRHTAKNREYAGIREKLTGLGFKSSEVMRVFEVTNGFVYDFDKVMLKTMVSEFVKNEDGGESAVKRISTAYDKRRNTDMQRLSDHLVESARNGQTDVLVALFSKVNDFTIKFHTAKEGGKRKAYSLPAFAIRHWDLQDLNLDYLTPRGYIISHIEIVEILPSENGISFKLKCKEFTQ